MQEGNKNIPACWPIISLPAYKHNAAHKVLTKTIPYYRRHKMHLNMWWPNQNRAIEFLSWQNPSNASQDKKLSTSKHTSTQNACQLVLTKPLQCQWGHNMYLHLLTHSMTKAILCQRQHKCILTCVEQPYQHVYPKPYMTQNVTQHVTQPLPTST
jgi:hypothetical protein